MTLKTQAVSQFLDYLAEPQVNNNWERLLYQSGIDWRKSAGLPDEAKEMLVDVNDMEKVSLDGKWIIFAGLADAWGM